MHNAPEDDPEGRLKPVLHTPDVHTMRMGHIPLTVFGTLAASLLFAAAFKLGFGPTIAAGALMVVLFVFAALARARQPGPPDADGAAPARKLTTGTRFTIIRIVLACMLGGVAILPGGPHPPELLSALVGFGIAAALVEACDNWLARVTSSDSDYSERLSTLTSALFVLVLAALPLQLGLLGPWVIAVGVLGVADAALTVRGPRGTLPLWQVWSRLAMRLLMLAALAPALPDEGRPLAAGLALAIAAGHVGRALYTRASTARREERSSFDA